MSPGTCAISSILDLGSCFLRFAFGLCRRLPPNDAARNYFEWSRACRAARRRAPDRTSGKRVCLCQLVLPTNFGRILHRFDKLLPRLFKLRPNNNNNNNNNNSNKATIPKHWLALVPCVFQMHSMQGGLRLRQRLRDWPDM